MKRSAVIVLLAVVGLLGIIYYLGRGTRIARPIYTVPNNQSNAIAFMTISSPAFLAGQPIPKKYSCDGSPPAGGINPPLEFSGVPARAKSLVLIMDDPDVPKSLKPDGLFVHWVVYGMPPGTTSIAENSTPPGTEGLNGGGKPGYTPPCPPDREHRYFFKLYALDSVFNFDQPPTKDSLEAAMAGHIIEQAQLMGTYAR